jgi:hypothetical protein
MNLSEHINQVEKEIKGVLTERVGSPIAEENVEEMEHELAHKKSSQKFPVEDEERAAWEKEGSEHEKEHGDALDQKMSEMANTPASPYKQIKSRVASRNFPVDDEVDEATLHMPQGDTGGLDGMRDMISMFDLDDVKGQGGEFSFDADRDGDADVKMAFGDLEDDHDWAYKGMGEDEDDGLISDEDDGWTDTDGGGLNVSFGDEQGINTHQPMADADEETDLDWSKIGKAFKGMSKFF